MKSEDLTRDNYNKVFLFDLDSTITREELLPRIAKLNNTFDELKSLTREAMLNGSDFESSFRERVSILAQIPLSEVQECVRTVPLLEELMGWIQQNLKCTFIVTGNLDIWIETLLNSYSLKSFSSTARVVDSRVHINQTLDKEKVIEAFMDDFIVYVGDGSNDIGIMELSDIGILTEIVHESPRGLWEVADYAVKDERTLCNLLKRL
jgi:HAD superfamily phosphoserine phosphatase-like hydrolase